MAYESNKGISKVASVMSGRMREMTDTVPVALDVGMIQEDYSLKLNNYEKPIPKGEYSLCRQLTLGETDTHLTYTIWAGEPYDGTHSHGVSGKHSHGGGQHGGHNGGTGEHFHSGDGEHVHQNEGPHVHDVLIPEKMRSLLPGDRVLIAWVQNDAVVVDIIVKS